MLLDLRLECRRQPMTIEGRLEDQCRGGSCNGYVGPLPLGLNAKVGTGLGERDLDLPAADEQGDDVGGLDGDVRAEEGLRGAFAIWIPDSVVTLTAAV